MAGGEVSKTTKPQLRGLLAGQIKWNIIIAATMAAAAAIAQKVFVNDQRKKDYAAFYSAFSAPGLMEGYYKSGLHISSL
ncbi:cytochrome c oxidase subunit 6C [Diabrotica virgifera virgifera]|uniref:Mitochondrial cytochrome c oxidase subunit VIc/VIIs domain-containing protein n=1 Tax=Diabrotica virgifera virgifera TaxID=50390 RepID=A0ABM5KBH4_DIAVI|nr:cytochrome c oxidase subunit 6C [Diabrotica virgifera virgifera]